MARWIEYGGVRRDVEHLAEPVQQQLERELVLYAEANMRPPFLAVIVAGEDVTLDPSRWPKVERTYRGPGRLELLGPAELFAG